MFDHIAPRYDLLNRILSFGIDKRWREKAVRMVVEDDPNRLLDVATGTGDLAIAAAEAGDGTVTGVDIAEQMLEVGRKKIERLGLQDRIALQTGDAESLPFADASFDAAMVAFGVRNFEDLHLGLREIARVLAPGGKLAVLEFSRPTAFPVRQIYEIYSRHILPRVGRTVSRDAGAYRYLPESIDAFPDGEDFLTIMRETGFEMLQVDRLSFGIASLYCGRAARR